jgi:hypothetical protein
MIGLYHNPGVVMKQYFAIILVIFMLIGGKAFSQEVKVGSGTLTFSGKIASGIFYDDDNAPKKDTIGNPINTGFIGSEGRVRWWNETDNKTPLRTDLTALYTWNNVGFRVRLRADNALDGLDRGVIARYAYGWVYFFDDILKATAGYIDLSDNVWGTLGDGDWDIGGNGLRLEFKPLKIFNNVLGWDEQKTGSLNMGAFFMVPAEGNTIKGKDDEGNPDDRSVVTLRKLLSETALGFRYTHPWFYAGAQFKLDSDLDGMDLYEEDSGLIYTMDPVWSPAWDESRLMFGAGVTVLPELVFTAEGNIEGLGNWGARGKADLRQTASYTLFDRLTIGIKAQEILWGYDMSKHLDNGPFELDPWMQFKPFVDFKVTPEFTAGLEAGFGFGYWVEGNFEHSNGSFTGNGTGNKDKSQTLISNEASNIFIKPNLSYNFSNGLALKAWYKVTFITYADLADAPAYVNLQGSYVPKDIDNVHLLDGLQKSQFALEFVWSF